MLNQQLFFSLKMLRKLPAYFLKHNKKILIFFIFKCIRFLDTQENKLNLLRFIYRILLVIFHILHNLKSQQGVSSFRERFLISALSGCIHCQHCVLLPPIEEERKRGMRID